MRLAKQRQFRELRRVFSGYLHEDFNRESGTAENALKIFRAEASHAEVQRFQRELERFLALTESLSLDDLRARLHELGCRWVPPSREAVAALLNQIP